MIEPAGGNTPARAGKTPESARRLRRRWEHPRSRGEDKPTATVKGSKPGTPPLARGRLPVTPGGEDLNGNIPARAGKTYPPRLSGSQRREHPRSRGEDRVSSQRWRSLSGTPPLARGRLAPTHPPPRIVGNTPARAGKTPVEDTLARDCREHPRSRGEDFIYTANQPLHVGTPPLARGRPDLVLWYLTQPGNTPARAGKTFALN